MENSGDNSNLYDSQLYELYNKLERLTDEIKKIEEEKNKSLLLEHKENEQVITNYEDEYNSLWSHRNARRKKCEEQEKNVDKK